MGSKKLDNTMSDVYLQVSVLILIFFNEVDADTGQGVTEDGFQRAGRCEDIGYMIQNCTRSLDYRLVDNMPIVLNATEIKLFCLNKNTTLACIQQHMGMCKDDLVGVSAVIYDMNMFNVTYNTLCDNMELMWWSETSCILQLDSKLRECRWKKEELLRDVHRTGSSAIYCQALDELYACNTYDADSICIEAYSDFLTKYYRGMLTPSVCDENLPSNQQVSYTTSGDVMSTTIAGVSSDAACKLCNRLHIIGCVLFVGILHSFISFI